MCIGGDNVYAALGQHALGPIEGFATETSGERTCRDLHPDAVS